MPKEEDQQCQQLNHIDTDRPSMQASKLLSGVGISIEFSVAELVNARHQNLPHPPSRALLGGCGKFWCRALTNSATLNSMEMPTPDSSLLACIDGRSVSIWFNCWHC